MTRPGPLTGYRIVEFATEGGQFTGRMLAGLGAEVIKIEPMGGDPLRGIGPFYKDQPHPERSLAFWVFNAGKKSITLDAQQPEGREMAKRLIKTADVFLTCQQPGLLESLGLDYASLKKENPSLVMTTITGFGETGPYSSYTWSDIVLMALSGVTYLLGEAERPPVRMGPPQAYLTSNLQAATGTCFALFHRTRTGAGQRVDLSIQEAVKFCLNGPGSITSWWTMHKTNVTRTGDRMNFGDYKPLTLAPCKDGYTANAAIFGNAFPPLLELMKAENAAEELVEPKWLDASPFGALPGQWMPTEEQVHRVEEIFVNWQMKHTKAEIYQMAMKHGLWVYPVNTPSDIVSNHQLKARGYFVDVEHPAFDRPVTTMGAPFVFSESPWVAEGRPPMLGEHNGEIFDSVLGLSKAEQTALRAAGVV